MTIRKYVSFDGKRYPYDERLTVQEARKIKAETELRPREFFDAIGELDPDAVAALVVMVAARQGETIRLSEVNGDIFSTDILWFDDDRELDLRPEDGGIALYYKDNGDRYVDPTAEAADAAEPSQSHPETPA